MNYSRPYCHFDLNFIPLNPLNAELNPICHLLALLGAHPILHINRIRVNRLAPELFFLILAHSVYKM